MIPAFHTILVNYFLYFSLFLESIKNVLNSLNSKLKNTIICNVVRNESNCDEIVLGRRVNNIIKEWTDSATLIFVGMDSSPLLLIWLMTFVQFTNIICYSPKDKAAKIVK